MDCTWSPLQTGLQGSPWHVAVASMLLCRAKRNPYVAQSLFQRWPTPHALAASGEELENLVRPLGMHRVRARHMQLLSHRWDAEWEDLRDMKGIGTYVGAAVELFCFGHVDNADCDHVLSKYAKNYVSPRMLSPTNVDGVEFASALEAYGAYTDRLASLDSSGVG